MRHPRDTDLTMPCQTRNCTRNR